MGLFEWIADLFGFTAPSVIEIIFVCCAVFGSLFFILMMVLMLVGDILGGVIDTAFDTDVSMDSTLAFELFSCLLYTSPSPRDRQKSRMPSSA